MNRPYIQIILRRVAKCNTPILYIIIAPKAREVAVQKRRRRG